MGDKPYKILLVEDDTDVRESIKDLISMDGYECVVAINGIKGLEQASDFEPDLIITDVMMPEMDGFRMVEALRSDPQLVHIPVIILTARVADKDRIKGLELGAVDYLTKPFNGKELSLKIRNLLNQQENYFYRSWNYLISGRVKENLYDDDKSFLKELHRSIIDNIDTHGFGVPQLAAQLNMSERNLYRKVHELTGMPVAAYVKELRLQRAHHLIQSNNTYSKAEIASRVGFKSLSHFIKAYSKRFN